MQPELASAMAVPEFPGAPELNNRGYGENPSSRTLPAHALLLPYPAQGHINPMLHLARRLLSVGFTLTIVNTEPFHKLLQQAWKCSHPKIRLFSVPDPLQSGTGQEVHYAFMNSSQPGFRKDVESLLEQWKEGISCIIYDPFFPWVPDLQLGITSVAFFTSSVVTTLAMKELPKLMEDGIVPVKKRAATRDSAPLISIPGVPCMINAYDLPSALHDEDPYDPGYKARITRYTRIFRASWILANTVEDLEADALAALGSKFITVGPLLPSKALGENGQEELGMGSGLWEEDQTCIKWLDTQRKCSVLYVSFGSLANLTEDQVMELAYGLEMSKQPFLWVFRTNLVNGSSKGLLDEFITRTGDRGLVIDWAPQVEVLQHPSVGGFLTHCGWNSTLEGVCAGIPMLAWPCMAEQHLNCRYIADVWNIGLRLCDSGIAERTEAAQKINVLMKEEHGQEMRRRAQDLKTVVKQASTGSSYKNLFSFARAMSHGSRSDFIV